MPCVPVCGVMCVLYWMAEWPNRATPFAGRQRRARLALPRPLQPQRTSAQPVCVGTPKVDGATVRVRLRLDRHADMVEAALDHREPALLLLRWRGGGAACPAHLHHIQQKQQQQGVVLGGQPLQGGGAVAVLLPRPVEAKGMVVLRLEDGDVEVVLRRKGDDRPVVLHLQ